VHHDEGGGRSPVPRGGYQLLDGYRTRLTGLTAAEAQALFLSGLPGPAAELGLGPVLAAAQLKLLAALPPGLGEQVGRVQARFHLDAPGWYAAPDEVPLLPAVAGAVEQACREFLALGADIEVLEPPALRTRLAAAARATAALYD
jgi:predicted DNA-binding transcriptional regulator YafY